MATRSNSSSSNTELSSVQELEQTVAPAPLTRDHHRCALFVIGCLIVWYLQIGANDSTMQSTSLHQIKTKTYKQLSLLENNDTTAQQEADPKPEDDDDEDSQLCDFFDDEERAQNWNAGPEWTDYTEAQKKTFVDIFHCYNRIIQHGNQPKPFPHGPFPNRGRSKLQCNRSKQKKKPQPPISFEQVKTMRKIVGKYRRIWFVGDSVLGQTFHAIVCMLDPNATLVEGDYLNGSDYYVISTPSTSTTSSNNITTDTATSRDTGGSTQQEQEEHTAVATRTTRLSQIAFGNRFGGRKNLEQIKLVTELLNKHTSKDDAIILNAGLHWHHSEIVEYHRILHTYADIATLHPDTNKPAFAFVETPDEQFPTSNGMWAPTCVNMACACQPLNADGIAGKGQVARNLQNLLKQPSFISLLQNPEINEFIATHLYREQQPAHQMLSSGNESNKTMDLSPENYHGSLYKNSTIGPLFYKPAYWPPRPIVPRVPSNLPANWRNHLAHGIFSSSSKNHPNKDRVHVIPVWNQLVAQGRLHNRGDDCIHKSLDALLAMAEQIFRWLDSQK